MQDLTGRTLVADSVDNWSKNTEWYFSDELTLSGGPTFTNNRRPNGQNLTYTFVPFHTALGYRTDGTTGGPALTWATAQPAISDTLSSLGVESAANGAARVRQQAGALSKSN
jgi:hypothetical protein